MPIDKVAVRCESKIWESLAPARCQERENPHILKPY